jgi:Pyruvate/2-oxoacid:ferredoxin oxidoreductase delta subunit
MYYPTPHISAAPALSRASRSSRIFRFAAPIISRSRCLRCRLKYHPDKIQNPTAADIDKFHFLQIAYDVLSDTSVIISRSRCLRCRASRALS